MAKKYTILVPTIHQFSAEILRGYQGGEVDVAGITYTKLKKIILTIPTR